MDWLSTAILLNELPIFSTFAALNKELNGLNATVLPDAPELPSMSTILVCNVLVVLSEPDSGTCWCVAGITLDGIVVPTGGSAIRNALPVNVIVLRLLGEFKMMLCPIVFN
jgi:hypothetical protein